MQKLEGHSGGVSSVAFSHDGKQVVSGSWDKTLRIWDAVTGKEVQKLEGHSHWVNSVAFSHDGKQVVSGSNDKTLRIWDQATGKVLTTETAFEFLLPCWTDLLPMTPHSFGDLILYVEEGDHGRRLCVTTANPKPFVLGRLPYEHPFSGRFVRGRLGAAMRCTGAIAGEY